MIAWIVTLICMYFYRLSGEKLREIQAVNAVRKAAIAGGMPKEEAMKTWQTIDQVPAEYVQDAAKTQKENIMDKIYNRIWGRKEKTKAAPSANAIQIPPQYRK